ncbi:Septal ring factor EnvC [Pseudomonas syringae pv. actinidiae]|uniref:Septal ring factor EnvC n=1 Tax=Pseudomonas syringae pv. actinidiae TaxID=103796 RepID=A0A2V0QGN4_PSESF|nr:Septal ring factor EnvC [Pseudomonas syringae pv. actinidiae]
MQIAVKRSRIELQCFVGALQQLDMLRGDGSISLGKLSEKIADSALFIVLQCSNSLFKT